MSEENTTQVEEQEMLIKDTPDPTPTQQPTPSADSTENPDGKTAFLIMCAVAAVLLIFYFFILPVLQPGTLGPSSILM